MKPLSHLRAGALALAAGLAALFVAGETRADADRRVALVIGNAAYQHVPELANPLLDSKAMAASLKRLGFEVVEGYDQKLDAMRSTVGEFAAKLDGAKVALVYYAGHGIAVGGDNHLLPVDAVLKTEADVDFRTLNMSLVLRQMQRDERVNLVILDACRDNPFATQLARSLKGTRSAAVSTGLSEINANAAAGTLIAFATDPGKTALDGERGGNSPFTTALLKHMETPGISISSVMDRVREDVWRSTGEKQRPWVNTSLIGEFYLNGQVQQRVAALPAGDVPGLPQSPAAPTGTGFDRQALEMKLWESAERSNTVEDYKSYLEAHPTGYFAALARNRIAKLSGGAPEKAAVALDDTVLKGEAGTARTEDDLKLTAADRTEAQHRLRVSGFDPGGASGKFGPGTRRALTDWQRSRSIPETGYMTRMQLAALREQSEAAYKGWLSAQSAPRTVRAPVVRAAPVAGEAAAAPAQAAPRRAAAAPAQAAPAPERGPSAGEVGQLLNGMGGFMQGVGSLRR